MDLSALVAANLRVLVPDVAGEETVDICGDGSIAVSWRFQKASPLFVDICWFLRGCNALDGLLMKSVRKPDRIAPILSFQSSFPRQASHESCSFPQNQQEPRKCNIKFDRTRLMPKQG